jgi:hypothetical protein
MQPVKKNQQHTQKQDKNYTWFGQYCLRPQSTPDILLYHFEWTTNCGSADLTHTVYLSHSRKNTQSVFCSLSQKNTTPVFFLLSWRNSLTCVSPFSTLTWRSSLLPTSSSLLLVLGWFARHGGMAIYSLKVSNIFLQLRKEKHAALTLLAHSHVFLLSSRSPPSRSSLVNKCEPPSRSPPSRSSLVNKCEPQ